MRPGRSRARAARPAARGAARLRASSGVASLPRLEANAIWARTGRSGRAANSSSGPVARDGEQAARGVEGARLDVGVGGSERALHSLRRIGRQLGGACQERGGGGEPAARLRPAGRALELGGDLLVGPPASRARGARRAGPGRLRHRSPRRARDARGGGRRRRPSGRRRIGRADARTRRARRS